MEFHYNQYHEHMEQHQDHHPDQLCGGEIQCDLCDSSCQIFHDQCMECGKVADNDQLERYQECYHHSMEWNQVSDYFGNCFCQIFHTECRYKMLGYRISFEGETLYVFDLLVPEIFHEGQKRKNETDQKNAQETKPANTRKGFYPDDIAGTFGVPVEEHLKESEVKQMDGYVSVGMLTGKTVPDTGLD